MKNKNEIIGVRMYVHTRHIESALYGASTGSRYWCANASDLAYESTINKVLHENRIWTAEDAEEGKRHDLHMQAIKKGLRAMAKKQPGHFTDLLSEDNADEVTGDVFLQCCLFGDVIYG